MLLFLFHVWIAVVPGAQIRDSPTVINGSQIKYEMAWFLLQTACLRGQAHRKE